VCMGEGGCRRTDLGVLLINNGADVNVVTKAVTKGPVSCFCCAVSYVSFDPSLECSFVVRKSSFTF